MSNKFKIQKSCWGFLIHIAIMQLFEWVQVFVEKQCISKTGVAAKSNVSFSMTNLELLGEIR